MQRTIRELRQRSRDHLEAEQASQVADRQRQRQTSTLQAESTRRRLALPVACQPYGRQGFVEITSAKQPNDVRIAGQQPTEKGGVSPGPVDRFTQLALPVRHDLSLASHNVDFKDTTQIKFVINCIMNPMTFAEQNSGAQEPVHVSWPLANRAVAESLALAFPPTQASFDPEIAKLLARLC